MAKGNNGNLLQHFVEAELAARLNSPGLHLISTHSMAPTEGCTAKTNFALLRDFIENASQESAIAVHRAYAACNASLTRYPNTWRLLDALVGRDNLTGLASEYDQVTYNKLREAGTSTRVSFLCGSWRRHTHDYIRSDCKSPWLITMDPYTFESETFKDPGNLWNSDVYLLRGVVDRFLESGHRGAVSIFCYSMPENRFDDFREWSVDLGDRLGVHFDFVSTSAGTVHGNPSRHGGVVLSADEDLISQVRSCWDRVG